MDTVRYNTRYIQASTNSGRKARGYWLSGVRRAVIHPWDMEGDFKGNFGR